LWQATLIPGAAPLNTLRTFTTKYTGAPEMAIYQRASDIGGKVLTQNIAKGESRSTAIANALTAMAPQIAQDCAQAHP
jgi:hypothetical protein